MKSTYIIFIKHNRDVRLSYLYARGAAQCMRYENVLNIW